MPERDEDSFTSRDLVRTFAWRAGLAIVILAVVIGIATSWMVESIMRSESLRVSGIAADALLRHELTGTPAEGPLSAETKARIDEICMNDLAKNGITATKVWGKRGVLLYSSEPGDQVGKVIENDEAAEARDTGKVITEIGSRPDQEDLDQFRRVGPLVEVYRPLDNGVVLEMYQSFTPIAASIEQTRSLAWLAVLAFTLPAYLIELQIVRRAARKLDRQDSALKQTNERLEASIEDLEEHALGTLAALAATVDAKDSYTATHSLMVADYAAAIGARLGLSEDELRILEQACLVHDIGKIAVPESILGKPARLTPKEYETIKLHAEKGHEIVASIPFLRQAAEAVRHHHERYDGAGYPDGLAGEEISVLARILAVADTFDAMTSNRPYRPALSLEQATAELRKVVGSQLCPTAVPALLEAIESGEIALAHRHRVDRAS